MADRVILSQKEKLDREIAAYRGDDPLKLRYDFLLWLDSNYGKDKVIDIFTSTLEEALNTHWDDARYKEDNRLVELQMIYATLHPNPLTVYQSYYDRGVAQHSSVLYVNWANHLAAAGDFAGADKIFKMGSEKTSSAFKAELIKAFDKFLALVGRKFLDGEMPAEKEVKCAKCHVEKPPVAAPAAEDVMAIEINPGKAGCWDDFQTVVAYFDPPDDRFIRMYPKDKVYKDEGKEYSLEEVKAAEYFEQKKKKEQLEAQKIKEITNKKSLSFDPPFEIDPVMNAGVFPTPILPCSGKEDSISAQSFTTRTKLARHLVQDMWSSPTPEIQAPALAKTEEMPKPSFPIYIDNHPETPKAAEKKPVAPFQVFADSPDENNKNAATKKQSTVKKNGLQAKSNVFSERKLSKDEIEEEPKAVAKQHLNFESDNANEMLANKLSETSVSDSRIPFQPFGGIKPLFPVEQGKDDFSDVTCNTRAFNFALPSSTPVQQRKSLAPYPNAQQNSGSIVPQDERPSYHTQQNLSVILEASKERCSSSGSSTGSSQPRTPAFPATKSLVAGNMKLSQSRKKQKRNSYETRSNVMQNVDSYRKKRVERPTPAKRYETRNTTSDFHADCLKEIEDIFPDHHRRFVMQNKSSYKTPVRGRKKMAGSESCPAHLSGSVNTSTMVLRRHRRGSYEGLLKPGSYRECSTPFVTSSPTDRYHLRSAGQAQRNVPKQLIMEDCNDIDPFCSNLNDKLLAFLSFPQPHHSVGYQVVNSNLPSVSKSYRLGNDVFTTYGDLGKGAYARVLRASIENSNVALKIEKPACRWEFYIAKEIQRRVDPKTRSAFMDISTAYIFSNGSVLMTEWAKHGSLLNIINQYKQQTGKVLEPVLSLHFAIEVTRAVEYLHKCKIIHGDIKPDNFVVRSLPTVNETEPCLMLIDFGRSIDMTLFPEGTKFSRVVTTEGFQCNEMKEKKHWTYQTDLYGLAGTIYCLLIGDYMRVTQKPDGWKLSKVLPRNMRRDLWDPIFHQLLNAPSCDQLPNLTEIRKTLEATFAEVNHYVKLQYFNHLTNIAMGK